MVTEPATVLSLFLEVLRDDGVAAYLNGQEFYRNNLPAGPLAFADLATNATDNGTIVQSATLPPTALVAGTNVLAVELHQSSASSSDAVFDLRLSANPVPPPVRLHFVRLGAELVLYWNDPDYALESAPELAGPWNPMPDENPQVVSPTDARRFFRLRK